MNNFKFIATFKSALSIFLNLIRDGWNGIITENTFDGWNKSLNNLADDVKLRKIISKNALNDIRINYNIQKSSQILFDIIGGQ